VRRAARSSSALRTSPLARERPGPDSSGLTTNAGLALVAAATLGLAIYALVAHPVGDYATESDFFGGYAAGARALQHGRLDFGRYGVYGPGYEAALALAGSIVGDLFVAARLLSVLAAGVVLFTWWRIAQVRLGALAGLVLTAFLAADPTFVRYGYSVTNDMLALALLSLSAWASLALRGRWAPALAGIAAALAALTRYNLVSVLAAGALFYALRPRGRRLADLARFACGAALVLLPWTLASLASGHVPGALLVRDRGFYMGADPAATLEQRYRDLGNGAAAAARAAGGSGGLAGTARRVALGLPAHLRGDAMQLLGLPFALLSLAGLALVLAWRRTRELAPFAPFALTTLLPLAALFYSERYALPMLPLELLPAAWLVAALATTRWRVRARVAVAAGITLAALVPTMMWCANVQSDVRAQLPLEAREAGEALRGRVVPGERLLARKAHAAYFAGLEPVPFPLFGSLRSLAGYCRAQGVHYLFYSRSEAFARPGFGYLLDTSAVVPGLEVMHVTADPPSVTYRITAGFGAAPAWWSDATSRQRIAARVNALLAPGDEALPFYLKLADDELRRDRPEQALRDAQAAAKLAPRRVEAKLLAAEALRELGLPGAAIDTLRGALVIAPDDTLAQLDLGLALRDAGRDDEAAALWRPLVGRTRDPRVLREMDELFTSRGERDAAELARSELPGLSGN